MGVDFVPPTSTTSRPKGGADHRARLRDRRAPPRVERSSTVDRRGRGVALRRARLSATFRRDGASTNGGLRVPGGREVTADVLERRGSRRRVSSVESARGVRGAGTRRTPQSRHLEKKKKKKKGISRPGDSQREATRPRRRRRSNARPTPARGRRRGVAERRDVGRPRWAATTVVRRLDRGGTRALAWTACGLGDDVVVWSMAGRARHLRHPLGRASRPPRADSQRDPGEGECAPRTRRNARTSTTAFGRARSSRRFPRAGRGGRRHGSLVRTCWPPGHGREPASLKTKKKKKKNGDLSLAGRSSPRARVVSPAFARASAIAARDVGRARLDERARHPTTFASTLAWTASRRSAASRPPGVLGESALWKPGYLADGRTTPIPWTAWASSPPRAASARTDRQEFPGSVARTRDLAAREGAGANDVIRRRRPRASRLEADDANWLGRSAFERAVACVRRANAARPGATPTTEGPRWCAHALVVGEAGTT